MHVQHNLKASATCPTNGLVDILLLPLDIRVTALRGDSPVADGNADMIEASVRNVLKVGLRVPGRPVLLENASALIRAEMLTKSELIHDAIVLIWLEDRRGDPRLKDEPTAQVHASYLLIVIVERQGSLLGRWEGTNAGGERRNSDDEILVKHVLEMCDTKEILGG